jgi:hypothetical protein
VFCRSLFVFSGVCVVRQSTTQKTADRATQTPLKKTTIYKTLHRKLNIEQHKVRFSVFCVVFCRSLFVFNGVCVARSSVFCVVFCRSLFVFNGACVSLSSVTLHRKLNIEQHKPH